ncbi:MAG TPA: hypothetical protein VGV38_11190 [Pyrinomonadaceae bacterium]|nr:hypothetical protein [Pyrinomonadaceae bacterium]
MVTKNGSEAAAGERAKHGRVKLGKLRLNKETVRDLTGVETKLIKGGATNTVCSNCCSYKDSIKCDSFTTA